MTTGGLTYWAKSADHVIAGNGTSGTALINMIKDTLGVKWHKYDSTVSLSGGTPKFWDGTSEGWYARVDKSRLLYIKKFVPITPAQKAPVNENQIEYYTNNNTRTILEMELQSAYDSVATGDSLAWDVKWYVRQLPDSIPVTPNAALLAFTRQTVAGNIVAVRGQTRMLAGAGLRGRLLVSGDRIGVTLDKSLKVSLAVVDSRGGTIQNLHDGALSGGYHAFSLGTVPQGIYWLILKNGSGKILESRMLTRL
jgi:hypothetical protein